MVSSRYRANKSLTQKVSRIDSKASTLAKKTADPHLSNEAVTGDNIVNQSVTASSLAPETVNALTLGRGAVGTENLGVVSNLTSDSSLVINLPGVVMLDGASYPLPPTGVAYPLVNRTDGGVVQGGAALDATVDPYWTFGMPNVVLTSTGATVPTTGWSGQMSTPTPGLAVKVAWDGLGWFILGALGPADAGFLRSVNLLPSLNSPWVAYDTSWHEPSVTKTSDGIVMLEGLLKTSIGVAADSTICTLPVGFRPDAEYTFLAMGLNNQAIRIRVKVNGEVVWVHSGTNIVAGNYIALGGVVYPAAGVATWTDIAAAGTPTVAAFATGWSNAFTPSSTNPAAGYWKDSYGIVWWRGQIKCTSSVSVDNTVMIQYNSQALSSTGEAHFPAHKTGGVFAGMGSGASGTGLRFKNTSTLTAGDFINLTGIALASSASDTAMSWTNYTFQNSWIQYPGTFTTASRANRNGIIFHKGLIYNGTIGGSATTMPVGSRSRSWYLNPGLALGNIVPRIANLAIGRLDIGGTGVLVPATGSNAWWSMDGVMHVKEQ